MKNLYLFVFTQSPSYFNGDVKIGLYSGKDLDEATVKATAAGGGYGIEVKGTPVDGEPLDVVQLPATQKEDY